MPDRSGLVDAPGGDRRAYCWLAACMSSNRSALYRPYMTSRSTNANGSPMMMVAFSGGYAADQQHPDGEQADGHRAEGLRRGPVDGGVLTRAGLPSAAESAEVTWLSSRRVATPGLNGTAGSARQRSPAVEGATVRSSAISDGRPGSSAPWWRSPGPAAVRPPPAELRQPGRHKDSCGRVPGHGPGPVCASATGLPLPAAAAPRPAGRPLSRARAPFAARARPSR